MTRAGRILLIILGAAGACRPAQAQEFRVKPDHTVVFGGQHLLPDYLPEFTVLFSAADPQLKMRPAGIPDVQYNVATWLSDRPELNRTDRRADQSGDGFDDEILEGSVESRTANLFNAGRIIVVRPISHRAEGTDKVTFGYPENDLFSIAAELTADTATGRSLLTYRLTAKTGGWYSVGFTGFAGRDPKRADEIAAADLAGETVPRQKLPHARVPVSRPFGVRHLPQRDIRHSPTPPNSRSIRCRRPPTAASASPCATGRDWPRRCCSPRFRAASAPKRLRAGNSSFPHCSAESGATPRMRSKMSQSVCSASQATGTMRSVRSTGRSKT